MSQSFDDFMKTVTGQIFAERASQPLSSPGTLKDSLDALAADLNRLSTATSRPTYSPILLGLQKFAAKGAQVMAQHGVAQRDVKTTVADSREHSFKTADVRLSDVFNALSSERAYHEMMFGAGRETALEKSPSDLAFTVLGLTNEARDAAEKGDQNLALKKLKDAVATGIRCLDESMDINSISNRALDHYLAKKNAPGAP